MARNRQINLAVRAIYKDGIEKEFDTLKEASDYTGLSESAIKIRCNKSSDLYKQGVNFLWKDDATKRHFRAKNNRSKGKNLEYEIVLNLKKIGYQDVCRSAGESKNLDNNKVDIADPSNTLEVAILAKHTSHCPNYFAIRAATTDPRDFILIWKKSATAVENSKGTVAIMDVDFFYKLLDNYHRKNQ